MHDVTKANASALPIDYVYRGDAVQKVSIICGTALRYDAIGECALACLEAVASLGQEIEVRLYCMESNISDSRIHIVPSAQSMVADPFYQSSSIIIHHFGIINELHDALAVAPRSAYVMVQFYGVTPPQFMPKSWEGIIGDSFIQIGLFRNADEIVANSSYLEDELRQIGIEKPMRRIELFGVNMGDTPAEGARGLPHDTLDVVYCGRFVESKRVLQLVEALDSLVGDFPSVRLTLIGVSKYSDGGYFNEIKTRSAVSRVDVVFELNRSSEEVVTTIGAADLLVLPSLHEGFGMPVAEALAGLTPVVCSDAGSLPEVAGGLALLFKSSDGDALSKALHAALAARAAGEVMTESGRLPYAEWASQVRDFSAKYRRSAFVDRWRTAILAVLTNLEPSRLPLTAQTDAIRRMFPSEPLHAPGEAQLLGRFMMLKALGRIEADPLGTVDALHRWAFCRTADESATSYWREELGRKGIDELSATLASSSEVRNSSLHLRSVAGMRATLLEQPVETATNLVGGKATVLPPMDRKDVEHVLKSCQAPMEFIKAAYILILGREYDAQGLKDHINLALDKSNWDGIIDSFYASAEYRSRYGAVAI